MLLIPRGSGAVRVRHSYRSYLSGVIACTMAYVLAIHVTLALTLNAWLPPDIPFAFGEICHSVVAGNASDQSSGGAGAPVQAAAHCPLCLAPGFALLPPPGSPIVVLRRTLGIAFEVLDPKPLRVAAVTSSHRARAPPRA